MQYCCKDNGYGLCVACLRWFLSLHTMACLFCMLVDVGFCRLAPRYSNGVSAPLCVLNTVTSHQALCRDILKLHNPMAWGFWPIPQILTLG